MKNLFILLILCFVSCKAQQQILPLETKGRSIEGTYYKDLDNELNPYEGIWKGSFENKTFEITFTKVNLHEPIGKYDQDRLVGKYKMWDSNGNLLYSTYNLSNEDAKVFSLGFVEMTNHTKLRMMFSDLCKEGEIHISFINPQKTQLYWQYFTKQTMITDDSGCAPYNEMPRGEFVLTKQ